METKIDINAAVNFIFQDKEWVNKILVAGVLTLTFIGMIPVTGWAIEIQRRVIKEEQDLLPDWSDLGTFTINGFKMMVVGFIYSLPVYLLWFPFMVVIFASAFSDNPDYFLGLMMVFGFVAPPIFIIFFILYYPIIPIISGLFAETNSIGQALNLSRVFQLVKANYLQLLGFSLLAYIASYAAGMVGMWLFFIGMFFTMPLGMGISYHFYGQAYRNALVKLDESSAA